MQVHITICDVLQTASAQLSTRPVSDHPLTGLPESISADQLHILVFLLTLKYS